MPPLPAQIGPYEIVRRLSQGGMGVLYLGRDPRIGRAVAIKVLHLHSDELRLRFLREARTAGGLQHPNIVTIYDVGEYDEQPYIAMEYIDGHTLAELIKQRAELSIPRRLELIEFLCDGLAYAHQRGVVHRDVKPANVMVSQHGLLKVLDFGIARVVDSGLTQVGLVIGTPNYMSPEQVEGVEVDRRSDVFSVGLLLYELLSFQQAFPGQTPHAVSFHILSREPASLERLVPDIDKTLCAIVDRALCKNRDARYQDLTTMRADLSRVRRRLMATTEETVVTARPRPDSRSVIDREALARRRRAQVHLHVEQAQAAAAEGRLDDAIEACEQALTLDPDESQALGLLHDVRERLNQAQLHGLLDEARRALERQALTEARHKLEEASLVAPGATEIANLERDLRRALEHRQNLAREQEFQSALSHGREAFAANAFDASLQFAREALALKADSSEARRLAEQAEESLQNLRSRQAWDRRAQDLVRLAERQFAAEHHREAIASLEAFVPPHPLVTAALDALRPQYLQIEAQARREAESRARMQWLEGQVVSARQLLGRDDASNAMALLEPLIREPDVPQTAHALYEDARRRVEVQRLQIGVARLVSQADALERNANFDAALDLLEQARDLLPRDDAVLLRHHRVRIARDEQRRRQAIDETLARAREQFAAGHWDDAVERLERASPTDDRIRRELTTLSLERTRLMEVQRKRQADTIQREEEEREATRRAEALNVAANRVIAAARIEIDAGRLDEAQRLLAGFTGNHPGVGAELASLTQRIEQLELDARAQQALERVLERLEHLDLPGAEAALSEVAGVAPDHAAVAAAMSAIDELRERYAAQQKREELLHDAADALRSADFGRASHLIDRVASETGENEALRALRSSLADSRNDFEQRAALEMQIRGATESLAAGNVSEGLTGIRAALQIDAEDGTLADLERAVLEHLQRAMERATRLDSAGRSHTRMTRIEQAIARDDADDILRLLQSDEALPDEGLALRRDFEASGPLVTRLNDEAVAHRAASEARAQEILQRTLDDHASTQERLLSRVDVGLERGQWTEVFAALQELQSRDPDVPGLSALVARASEAVVENRYKEERERATLESALDWAERSCARGQFLEAMARLRSLAHIPAANAAIERLNVRYGPFARAAGPISGEDPPLPTPPPGLRTPAPSGRVPAARPTTASASGNQRAVAESVGRTLAAVRERLQAAQALADAGQLSEAVKMGTAALSLDPRNADVLAFLDELNRRGTGGDGVPVRPSH